MKLDETEASMRRRMYGFTLREKKRKAQIRDILGLEPVSLIINKLTNWKGNLRWFGHNN